MEFEWDNAKAARILQERAIDFEDVVLIFDSPHIKLRSDQKGEERWLIVGIIAGECVTGVYTMREETIRIIPRGARANMSRNGFTRVTLEELRGRRGLSDGARIAATTDAEIEQQIAEDPDLQGFEDIDWSKAVAIDAPSKQAISIRLDADVLNFFKSGGAGYQGRINRVLRHYMDSKKKPAAE